MAYLKPQNPIKNRQDYIYPLTTHDQVILANGERWDGCVANMEQRIVELLPENWEFVPEESCFKQEVAVEGILSGDYPSVDIDMSNTNSENRYILQDNWQLVARLETCDGYVVFYCYDTTPSISLSVIIQFMRLSIAGLAYAEEASF